VPATAQAVNPETAVGGNGSKWFSGTLLQQSGNNCSILGGAYSETMVSAIAGYGGAPGGGVVRVGDRYYASLLVSIPGNPCGTGSSLVATDLVLPRGTSVDTSAPIRCFGQGRTASTFGELTGTTWGPFLGSNGPYCPSQVGSSLTGTSGAVGVGYRPLANGQLYQLFVPIKSTQTLQGAAASPADEIRWVLSTSGTYSNVGATSVWTNVFPAGSGTGNTPFIYLARNPSVEPFWLGSATPGTENRVEFFANLYSAGIPGNFCWELYAGASATGTPILTCSSVAWSGTITNQSDLWQVFGEGPNGGYVLLGFPASTTYTMRWKFTYNTNQVVTRDVTFTSLAGPDADGDGVPNASDACPNVKGTLGNGCQPDVQSDPDGDGIFGSADKCPDQNGGTSPDGCPPASAKPSDGGSAPGPDGPRPDDPPDAGDSTAPGISSAALAGRPKLVPALKSGFDTFVTTTEGGAATVDALVSGRDARGLKLAATKVAARGRRNLLGPGRHKVRVRFTKKAKKKFRRARTLKLTLRIAVVDAAGNRGTKTAKVTLKR
jgi:hypothetical protein